MPMTPYTDRREAGHYDPPSKRKGKGKASSSTTSKNIKGLTGTK